MTEPSPPDIHDFANAEHCVLEEATVEHPSFLPEFAGGKDPKEVTYDVVIRDAFRRRRTRLRIFSEGWLDIELTRSSQTPEFTRINLRYIDAAPTIERHFPVELFKLTGITAAAAIVATLMAVMGWLSVYSVPTAFTLGAATIAGLWFSFYGSHEKIVFQTLHGRAGAIALTAGLGTIRKYHKLVPKLVEAIAGAAEAVHEETAIYLRAEMREHYRLCNEGVLTEEECAESTGRILKNFGTPA